MVLNRGMAAVPRVIGSGAQGVVLENAEGFVIKKTSKKDALKEERAAEILRVIDPDQNYTVYGISFAPTNDNKKVKITMPFGGEPLSKLDNLAFVVYKGVGTPENRKLFDTFYAELPKIVKGFEKLIEWMPTMHQAGMTHSDIGAGNLLWDGENLRLIDWGYSQYPEDSGFERDKAADLSGLASTLDYLLDEIKKAEAVSKSGEAPKGGGRRRRSKTRKLR